MNKYELTSEEIKNAYDYGYSRKVHTPSMNTPYPSLTEEIEAKEANGRKAISDAARSKVLSMLSSSDVVEELASV